MVDTSGLGRSDGNFREHVEHHVHHGADLELIFQGRHVVFRLTTALGLFLATSSCTRRCNAMIHVNRAKTAGPPLASPSVRSAGVSQRADAGEMGGRLDSGVRGMAARPYVSAMQHSE
jgi:hypothetical protein